MKSHAHIDYPINYFEEAGPNSLDYALFLLLVTPLLYIALHKMNKCLKQTNNKAKRSLKSQNDEDSKQQLSQADLESEDIEKTTSGSKNRKSTKDTTNVLLKRLEKKVVEIQNEQVQIKKEQVQIKKQLKKKNSHLQRLQHSFGFVNKSEASKNDQSKDDSLETTTKKIEKPTQQQVAEKNLSKSISLDPKNFNNLPIYKDNLDKSENNFKKIKKSKSVDAATNHQSHLAKSIVPNVNKNEINNHPLYNELREYIKKFLPIDTENFDFHLDKLAKYSDSKSVSVAMYKFAYDYCFLNHSLRLLSLLEKKKNNYGMIDIWRNFIRHSKNKIEDYNELANLTVATFKALKNKEANADCFSQLEEKFSISYPTDDFETEFLKISQYETELKMIHESYLPYAIKRDASLYILSLLGNLKFSYGESANSIYRALGHIGFHLHYNDFADNLYEKTAAPLIKAIIERVKKREESKKAHPLSFSAPEFRPSQNSSNNNAGSKQTFFGSPDDKDEIDHKINNCVPEKSKKSASFEWRVKTK